VRELRDKAADLKLIAPSAATPVGAAGGPIDDAISALVNLGYKPTEAKRAVDSVVPEDGAEEMGLENVIRRALAVLASER
jgi:Holliday junction DNA helicase RuvA